MKKITKTSSIIITAFLTFINVYKLIPSENAISVFVRRIIVFLKSVVNLEIYIYFILLILGLFVIVNMILELKNESTNHKLKKGSRRFYRFFSKWYNRSGVLSIICDDVEWISDGKDTRVLDVLIQKSKDNKLNLYILDDHSPYAIKLKENGAKVYSISKNIISNYSLSCISFMGNNSAVIVREKRNDQNSVIKFNEISNNYVSSLLNALIMENEE